MGHQEEPTGHREETTRRQDGPTGRLSHMNRLTDLRAFTDLLGAEVIICVLLESRSPLQNQDRHFYILLLKAQNEACHQVCNQNLATSHREYTERIQKQHLEDLYKRRLHISLQAD